MKSSKTASVNGTGDDRQGPAQTTRKSKTKSRSNSKSKSKRRSRAPRSRTSSTEPRLSAAESSRINGRKSKGPGTEAAKARSRYNALKHGMTAESVLLPGEDPAEFEARRLALHAQIRPRNALEGELVDRLARGSWMLERTERSAAARLEYRVHHQPRERASAEQEHVTKLGQYLLKDLFRPAGAMPCEREGGVRHPALVVLKLEATLTGCDWLLGHFDRLKERASIPGNWLEDDGFELVRLLGKYRGELTRDDLVAMVLLDSACLAEESVSRKLAHQSAKTRAQGVAEANALAEIAAARPAGSIPARSASEESDELDLDDEVTLDDELQFFNGPACQEYRELARRFSRPEYVVDDALKLIANQPSYGAPMLRLEKLNPRNVEHARERLTRVIDEYARRVREIHSVHARIKAADDARAAERLAFDPSPEADKERRYILSHGRFLNQTIGTLLKVRKAVSDGTIGEADTDGGDPFDLVAISPSLALRAGMGSAAPAEEGRSDTSPTRQRGSAMMPAESEPIHTSPTRQRGACDTAPDEGAREIPKSVAQVVTQSLAEPTTCAEPEIFRNDPGAHFDFAQCRHIAEPPVGATSPWRPTRTVPSAELRAGTSTPLSAGPVPSSPVPPINAARQQPGHAAIGAAAAAEPISGRPNHAGRPQSGSENDLCSRALEACKKPWNDLPREISEAVRDIQEDLWVHQRRGHRSAETIRKYTEFLQKYLG